MFDWEGGLCHKSSWESRPTFGEGEALQSGDFRTTLESAINWI